MSATNEWVPDRWMETDDDGRTWLVGGWSPTSGHHHFPLAGICPYSGADDVEAVRLSRTGTLWAWTAVTAAPPGYDGAVPYGFGVVELVPEGLRVIGRLTVADPGALSFGQAMEVVAETLPDGQQVWAFAPEAST
jgi:uncharacterized protein